ncbi:hypothetical protein PBV52_21270 [Streptomyces sp. T12]|uniref:hypothetical protein n=1 Tax=Streptomyces sp. T12 TaxID=477697 RepID=UPI00236587C8|nr:hypothetical protein [Streptomyces sp. T12]WDF39149.1 hypothetical protein PBV52_21270 [Streptomyces sp. T12]
MTTTHIAARPPARSDVAERDSRAWIAPLVATILLAFLGPAALLLGGLSAMATDSCGPDDCSPALNTQLSVIYGTLAFGTLPTLAAWITAWALPWQRRWSAWRTGAAITALLPPLFVLLLVFTLPTP